MNPNSPPSGNTGSCHERRAVGLRPSVNVGKGERWVSLVGGCTLALLGLRRRSVPGLGVALAGAGLAYRGWTGHCHLYDLFGLNTAEHPPQTSIPSGQGIKFEESIVLQAEAQDLFAYWRQLSNLPQIMRHLVAVCDLGGNRSRWTAQGLNGEISWEAEVITERPNELIGWRSLPGSAVATAGSIHFEPLPRNVGTKVTVELSYDPPGGRVGHALAWLVGRDPGSELRRDLHALQHAMESPRNLTDAYRFA